jgi:hypothetical protein
MAHMGEHRIVGEFYFTPLNLDLPAMTGDDEQDGKQFVTYLIPIG